MLNWFELKIVILAASERTKKTSNKTNLKIDIDSQRLQKHTQQSVIVYRWIEYIYVFNVFLINSLSICFYNQRERLRDLIPRWKAKLKNRRTVQRDKKLD